MSHGRWFRMYDEVLDDPKVQRLDPALFRTWVNVLCAASRRGGVIPPVDELAFMLRCDEAFLAAQLDDLALSGLIDDLDGDATPHNWNGRQFQSDTSTERVKRFRSKARNVSETPTVTPPETETETEEDTSSLRSDVVPADDTNAAFDAYNTIAPLVGWPLVQRRTKQRCAALKARLTECGGLDGWNAVLAKARASPFLCGVNDRGWKADFDFLTQAKSFTKLLEGSYDGQSPGLTAGNSGVLGALARIVEKRADAGGERMGSAVVALTDARPDSGNPQPIECPDIPPELRRGQRQGVGG